MKLLILFALFLAAVSANPYPRELYVEPIEENGRISNGQTASNGQFPYQVGLSMKMSAFTTSWCGGSLISAEWILTAAHCADGVKAITAYFGATERSRPQMTRTVKMNEVIIHSGWDPKIVSNDIALLKISPVTYSDRIQTVKLPAMSSSEPTYVGDYAIASGWGRMGDKSNSVAENLQYGRMQVVANSVCSRMYGPSTIKDSMICVSTPSRVSTCQGDSGGPLVLESGKTQIGLTSFGAAVGCEKGYPVVFTRTSSYLDWIKTNTGVSY